MPLAQATGCPLIGDRVWFCCHAPLSTMDWGTYGTDAAPEDSTCSTPPDLLNHMHSRRPDLYETSLGTTEPLGRPRCHLLWSQTDVECEQKHTEKTDGGLLTIAHVGKINAEDLRQGRRDSSQRRTGSPISSPISCMPVRHENALQCLT